MHAGATATEADFDVLDLGWCLGRTVVFVALEARLHGTVFGRHGMAALGLDCQGFDQFDEAFALLIPAQQHFGEAIVACFAGIVPRPKAVAMDPDGVALGAVFEGHNAGGGFVEQLAIMADEQNRFAARDNLIFEPALAGHVEVVVGLVEEEDFVWPAKEDFEHDAFLFTAREGIDAALGHGIEWFFEGRHTGDVPQDFLVVAADVAPFGDGLGIGHLRIFAAFAVHQPFRGDQFLAGFALPGGQDRNEQIAQRRFVTHRAYELAHDTQPT